VVPPTLSKIILEGSKNNQKKSAKNGANGEKVPKAPQMS
jgi:hypothetical protein